MLVAGSGEGMTATAGSDGGSTGSGGVVECDSLRFGLEW